MMSGLWIEFSAIYAQRAIAAFGISCGAAVPTEQDHPVTKITAFFRRQDGAKLFLYFLRVLALAKP